MTFIDWFAGIGGFRRGLELSGHTCVGFCEFDKWAVMSYTSMHLITEEQRGRLAQMPMKERQKEILKEEYKNGEWFAHDVRTVDPRRIPRAELWCFGFPCQDISIAGEQEGFNGARSSLFFRIMELLGEVREDQRPNTLLIENVKNLLSVNGGWDFARLLTSLDEHGYDAEWQILNSKDFGVPQNRERVFIVGHSRDHSGCEVFPLEGFDRQNRFQVEQNGYLPSNTRWNPQRYRVYESEKALAPTLDSMEGGGREPHIIIENQERDQDHGRNAVDGVHGISRTMLSRDYKDPIKVMMETEAAPEVVGGFGEMKSNSGTQWYQQDRIYNGDGIATSLTSNLNGGSNFYQIPMEESLSGVEVRIKEATELGYDTATEGDSINTAFADSTSPRGRVGHGIAQTLDTCATQGTIATRWNEKHQCEVAIRKLTPKECFRLQGWTDDYFDRAEFVNSDSQLYKQAGNGVTVTVIQAIGEKLHGEDEEVGNR